VRQRRAGYDPLSRPVRGVEEMGGRIRAQVTTLSDGLGKPHSGKNKLTDCFLRKRSDG
jgi:hypothetical protein